MISGVSILISYGLSRKNLLEFFLMCPGKYLREIAHAGFVDTLIKLISRIMPHKFVDANILKSNFSGSSRHFLWCCCPSLKVENKMRKELGPDPHFKHSAVNRRLIMMLHRSPMHIYFNIFYVFASLCSVNLNCSLHDNLFIIISTACMFCGIHFSPPVLSFMSVLV